MALLLTLFLLKSVIIIGNFKVLVFLKYMKSHISMGLFCRCKMLR